MTDEERMAKYLAAEKAFFDATNALNVGVVVVGPEGYVTSMCARCTVQALVTAATEVFMDEDEGVTQDEEHHTH